MPVGVWYVLLRIVVAVPLAFQVILARFEGDVVPVNACVENCYFDRL